MTDILNTGAMAETKEFNFTYSAKQQEEINSIRKKYLPKEESKLETLRRLDKEVETPGMIWSIIIGTVGALILGIGMCCTMVWEGVFVLGIIVGILGMLIVAAAYPVYLKITQKQREKIAPQIIALSNEISM